MNSDSFWGLRNRAKLTYTWREQLQIVGEVQDVRVGSMDPNGTGALATYRNAAEGDYNAHGTDIHLLWAEFRFTPAFSFRVRRQDLKVGPEVSYPEADWRYLKTARLGERLIGSVGFSHEERAADGITIRADFGESNLFVFAAQPTTGVFEVDQAYRPLHDVTYEGAQWTVKRGTWLPDTELAAFAIAYQDTLDRGRRAPARHLARDLRRLVARRIRARPRRVDFLFFGAGQLGQLQHARPGGLGAPRRGRLPARRAAAQAVAARRRERGVGRLEPERRRPPDVLQPAPHQPHLLRLRRPARAAERGEPVRAAPARAARDAGAEPVRALVPAREPRRLPLLGDGRLQHPDVRLPGAGRRAASPTWAASTTWSRPSPLTRR